MCSYIYVRLDNLYLDLYVVPIACCEPYILDAGETKVSMFCQEDGGEIGGLGA